MSIQTSLIYSVSLIATGVLSIAVWWVVRAASIIRAVMMMEAARISETSVDNYFTRQYIPEDKSELQLFI
jgi:hypothetical protein